MLFLSVIALAVIGYFIFKGMVHDLAFAGNGCMYRDRLGIKCTSCGGTRAVERLFAGDLWGAFAYNPLFFMFIAIGFVLFIAFGVNSFRRDFKPFRIKYRPWYLVVIGTAIVAFTIVRNLSFYPGFLY